jgi:glycosyltransferase involved in cell wall biosynthesis
MRIALIGPSHPFKGGIAAYTTQLYRQLNNEHEVLFCSFSRQYPDWLYPGDTDRDDSSTDLLEKDALPLIDSLNPLTWLKAANTIAEHEPDVVILPWWVMFWAPQFTTVICSLKRQLQGLRVIFICHNVIAHDSGFLSRLLTKWTLSLGDAYLLHSQTEAEALNKLLGDVTAEVAELPAYDTHALPAPTPQQARHKLGLSGNCLLFFGFVRPYKGLDVLLRALPDIITEEPCTLVVAGEIWGGSEQYKQLIEELNLQDRVSLLDQYIPEADIADYFLASDLVVLPYRSATGSGVIKLAYSFGRPVVATACGSLPAAVEEGVTGYIVEPESPLALSQAISLFFQRKDRNSMCLAARAKADTYSWEQITGSLQRLSKA